MSTQFAQDKVMDSLQAIASLMMSPMLQFVAETMHHPMVNSLITEGFVASERIKETTAQIQETLEDLAAQAQSKVAAEPLAHSNGARSASADVSSRSAEGWLQAEETQLATAIRQISTTLDQQMKRLTYGTVDLQLLMSIALAGLAIRQLLNKGFELDKIPWYTLAWYAFDNFAKAGRNDSAHANANALEDISQQLLELAKAAG